MNASPPNHNPVAGSPTNPVEDAAYCANQVQEQDSDRYLVALFQPKRLRQAAITLAAWNLELSNARPPSGEKTLGLIRLQWHRDALQEILAGNPRRHPVINALAVAHESGRVDAAALDAIVEARERDLDPEPPRDLAEVEAYARATSGALHRHLWRDTKAAQAAEDAGTAFALIGLARSEPINQARGRPWAPKALNGDLRPLIQRAIELAETKGPSAAIAPATIAKGYAKRALKAKYDPTSALMAAADPWRLWRLLMTKFL
jgi:phytoene/squalene synthetase